MPTTFVQGPAKAAFAAALLLAALPLAGCQSNGLVTGTTYPDDYRQRHPIALTYAPETLDVFAMRNAPGLDPRQATDVRDFAQSYKKEGRGPMLVLVPQQNTPKSTAHALSTVRSTLASAGVAGHQVQVQSYSSTDSALAAPIRLSFTKLDAKVAGECGDWRQDIGGVDIHFDNWQNKPWYNKGCAYQTQLAAQVADPLDLVRPRAETRVDTMKRMNAITKLRNGQDPSTQWRDKQTTISQAVGTN
jgi:pilus assembly protein CpaD